MFLKNISNFVSCRLHIKHTFLICSVHNENQLALFTLADTQLCYTCIAGFTYHFGYTIVCSRSFVPRLPMHFIIWCVGEPTNSDACFLHKTQAHLHLTISNVQTHVRPNVSMLVVHMSAILRSFFRFIKSTSMMN